MVACACTPQCGTCRAVYTVRVFAMHHECESVGVAKHKNLDALAPRGVEREPLSGGGGVASFSERLREDAFRHWCSAHGKGARRYADASDKAHADRWRCVYWKLNGPAHLKWISQLIYSHEVRDQTALPITSWPKTCSRKMVRLINHNLNQRLGSWEKKERKTEGGLGGNYSWDTRSSWTNYR